jgi:4-amino-4-deoxy-L-arabinose transferase-like glycosyltransferase
MLLAFNVTAVLFFLYLGDRHPISPNGKACIAAASVFAVLAFLSKGGVGIVLRVVSWGGYLLWQKQWKKLVSFFLLVLAFGIDCAALGLAFAYHTGGRELVENVVFKQVSGRIATESRKPGYYYFGCIMEIGGPWWVFISASFLPWKESTAFGQKVFRVGRLVEKHPEIRLSLAWFIGILAVFTIASTKKGRYILPLVVYGIEPDGDGVKFALPSERKPFSIRFVDTENARDLSDTPYLPIAKAREISELRKRLPERRWSLVGDGAIRAHRFVAYFIED